MIDAELIQQCADPRLNVEIVQQFVEQIGAADHLTITVTSRPIANGAITHAKITGQWRLPLPPVQGLSY